MYRKLLVTCSILVVATTVDLLQADRALVRRNPQSNGRNVETSTQQTLFETTADDETLSYYYEKVGQDDDSESADEVAEQQEPVDEQLVDEQPVDEQLVDEQSVDEQTTGIFRPTPRNITAYPMERAVLKCRIRELGRKILVWRKKNDNIPLTIGPYTFSSDMRLSANFNSRTSEWSLVIDNVTASDEGVYCCEVNTKDSRDSYEVQLFVHPIHVYGTNYVELGERIVLTCNATGRPEPPQNIDWFKNDEIIRSDARNGIVVTKKIAEGNTCSVLMIKQSRENDNGTYVCRSSNNESASINVMVFDRWTQAPLVIYP